MKGLKALKEVIKIQTSKGNWDYDPYMHGMANGLILAEALMEGKEPKYLDAPKKWVKDKKHIPPILAIASKPMPIYK